MANRHLSKSEVDKKLREINEPRIKDMQLGEMVDIMVLPQTWDEIFRDQVKEKYFELSKN